MGIEPGPALGEARALVHKPFLWPFLAYLFDGFYYFIIDLISSLLPSVL